MFDQNMLKNLMGKAYANALKSPDTSSQNGAVMCKRQPDGHLDIVANGYNHFYKGVPGEVDNREQKLKEIEHAERDCIYASAARGVQTKGSILICPWVACYDCARGIIGSEVSAVVYHKQRNDLTDARWLSNVNEALGWLQESGVYLFEFDGPVPGTKPILVSGKLWSPGSCTYV